MDRMSSLPLLQPPKGPQSAKMCFSQWRCQACQITAWGTDHRIRFGNHNYYQQKRTNIQRPASLNTLQQRN